MEPSTSLNPASEELQKKLLRLAWEGDYAKFKPQFEGAQPELDLEWKGTLPERYVKAPMRTIDIACIHGHWEIVFYLLEKGADLLHKNEHGTTLLHLCVLQGRDTHSMPPGKRKILQKLLQEDIQGIIDHKSDEQGLIYHHNIPLRVSALEMAARYGHMETVKSLIDKGAKKNGLAHQIIHRHHDITIETLRMCLEDVDEIDERGDTVLHIAVRINMENEEEKQCRLVELVLNHGVTPERKDFIGRTAWDLACEHHRVHLLSLFAAKELERLESSELNGTWYTPRLHHYVPVGFSEDIRKAKSIVVALTTNNMIWMLANAAHLAKCRTVERTRNYQNQIANHIDKHFVENQGNDDPLVSREVGLGIEKLQQERPGGGINNVKFMSIAMPFFYVRYKQFFEERFEDTADAHSDYTFCSTKNSRSLRICFSRSLDEHINPGIDRKMLDQRNADQVLSRYSSTREGMKVVVMSVAQAWIWKIGEDVIIAIRNTPLLVYVQDISTDCLQAGMSTDYVIGALLAELVTFLDRRYDARPDGPILTVFAKEIVLISDRVNAYIDDSRISTINMETEKGFFHQISDVREELSMIKRVLSQQEDIWREFVLNAWPDSKHWPDGPGGRFILRSDSESRNSSDDRKMEIERKIETPQYLFAKFKRRITELDEDAERMEKSIQIRLDLKQKHLSLQETRTMSVMSASVFAFTIITIIFTPLSFATSLFSLSVDEFARHQTTLSGREDPVYSAGYIAGSLAAVEVFALVVTFLATWISFKYFLKLDTKQMIEELWKFAGQEQDSRTKPGDSGDTSSFSDQQSSSRNSVEESHRPTEQSLSGLIYSSFQSLWNRTRGLLRHRNVRRQRADAIPLDNIQIGS